MLRWQIVEDGDERSDLIALPRGELLLTICLAETGEVVNQYELGDNLVVSNFGNQAVYLIGGEYLTTANINRVALGVGIEAAALADEAITNPSVGEVSSVVSSITYGTSPTSVQFEVLFGADDANGMDFTEAGLLFSGVSPNLAARKVFGGSMAKTSMFSWLFNWKLTWS